jgi:hypothetical protein
MPLPKSLHLNAMLLVFGGCVSLPTYAADCKPPSKKECKRINPEATSIERSGALDLYAVGVKVGESEVRPELSQNVVDALRGVYLTCNAAVDGPESRVEKYCLAVDNFAEIVLPQGRGAAGAATPQNPLLGAATPQNPLLGRWRVQLNAGEGKNTCLHVGVQNHQEATVVVEQNDGSDAVYARSDLLHLSMNGTRLLDEWHFEPDWDRRIGSTEWYWRDAVLRVAGDGQLIGNIHLFWSGTFTNCEADFVVTGTR